MSISRRISAAWTRARQCKTSTLADIVVIAGIPLFFLGQIWQEHREDVARSVEFGKILQSEKFFEAREILFLPWIERREELNTLLSMERPAPAVEDFVRDMVTENEAMISALYQIESLFLALRHCTDAGVCSEGAAQRVMGSEARAIYCFYRPAFEMIAKQMGLEHFGEAIRSFAVAGGACAAEDAPF